MATRPASRVDFRPSESLRLVRTKNHRELAGDGMFAAKALRVDVVSRVAPHGPLRTRRQCPDDVLRGPPGRGTSVVGGAGSEKHEPCVPFGFPDSVRSALISVSLYWPFDVPLGL